MKENITMYTSKATKAMILISLSIVIISLTGCGTHPIVKAAKDRQYTLSQELKGAEDNRQHLKFEKQRLKERVAILKQDLITLETVSSKTSVQRSQVEHLKKEIQKLNHELEIISDAYNY